MRRLAKVAGVITLVCFLFSASRSCHEIQNKYNQLNLLAVDLLRDIKQVMNEKNYSATSSVTVVIANSQRVLSIEEGYVFLEWVVGAVNNDPRLDILGDDYTTHLTTEQRERVRNLDLSMPEWPAKDYIKVDRDLIVVKMNPKTLGKF